MSVSDLLPSVKFPDQGEIFPVFFFCDFVVKKKKEDNQGKRSSIITRLLSRPFFMQNF